MNPITVGDVTYTSVAAAWRDLSPENLKLTTVRWRLREGWTPTQALVLGIVEPQNRRNFKDIRNG